MVKIVHKKVLNPSVTLLEVAAPQINSHSSQRTSHSSQRCDNSDQTGFLHRFSTLLFGRTSGHQEYTNKRYLYQP